MPKETQSLYADYPLTHTESIPSRLTWWNENGLGVIVALTCYSKSIPPDLSPLLYFTPL